jgi:hypothetical protein
MTSTIDVIVNVAGDSEGRPEQRRALPKILTPTHVARVTLDSPMVRDNIKALIDGFGASLLAENIASVAYEVDEIELSLSIDAKGGVALIGTFEVGGQAAIKVKLRRKARSS